VKSWSITEARTNIAEVFDSALTDGPQRIERRDRQSVVMVSEAMWRQLEADYPSFADIVLDAPVDPDDLPQRQPARIVSR
jgi:prevent-host-death family protein